MKPKKKLVIAEDHAIVRDGLRSILKSDEVLEVVGEAGDGMEAIRLINNTDPDVILLDLNMPKMDGFSVIREIKKQSREIRIIVLTMHKDEEYILEAFSSGADGYCIKTSPGKEVLNAIKIVLEGKQYVSPEISDKVLEGYIEGKKSIKKESSWDKITRREKEVLKLVGEGYQNKEISDYLCISVKTVEKHRANIMEKLDLHSASALTAYAINKGLITK
ncbi:MAG: response regulator transcription factor [Deltaproteobacteria bacterium]|nr:response regulator transcription factor [Deltaproteobacteria bacterium]